MKPGWGILNMAVLLVAAVPAAGCSTVCPAVGYASIITVTVAGDNSAVDEVQLCSNLGCSERQADYGLPVPIKTVAPDTPTPTETAPGSTHTPAPFLGTRTAPDTWAFTVSSAPLPQHVALRALSAGRTLLAQQETDLVWTRVGGSEQCGGPVTTPPIILRVP